jgi:hypothetical protein
MRERERERVTGVVLKVTGRVVFGLRDFKIDLSQRWTREVVFGSFPVLSIDAGGNLIYLRPPIARHESLLNH